MHARSRDHLQAVTRDVNARGVRVRFVEAGEGPTLLLVHGYLTSHVIFEDALHDLAASFRIIAPDLPGFGESEKPSPSRYPYTPDAFAESLVDLIAALDLPRVSVCGHGLGGAVALAMAADHPDVVDRLILVSPNVHAPPPDSVLRLAMQPLVGPLFFKQVLGPRLFRSYFQSYVHGRETKLPAERLAYLYDVFNVPAAREAAYATMNAMLDTRALVARLRRIASPTLVAWGRHDPKNPIANGRRLAREIRGARFEVFECGHSPAEECPSQFASALKAFVHENGKGG